MTGRNFAYFAAAHESLHGTFVTCWPRMRMSVHRGGAEVIGRLPKRRNDPGRHHPPILGRRGPFQPYESDCLSR
jgi:hypothetical protein